MEGTPARCEGQQFKLFQIKNVYRTNVSEIPIPATFSLQVHAGEQFTIYSDTTNQNVSISGNIPFGRNANDTVDIDAFAKYPLTQITYFNDHHIAIKAVCCNPVSKSVFFIPSGSGLYVAGANKGGQLGLNPNGTDFENRNEPVFTDQLKNVVDLQPAKRFTIAMCVSVSSEDIETIITVWSRTHTQNLEVPKVVVKQIVMYVQESVIYSTTNYPGSGLADSMDHCGWTRIEHFDAIQIVQIAVGDGHSLFLEDTGNLWSCGHDRYGHRVLGLGDFEMEKGLEIDEPPKMYFFRSDKLEQYAVTPREMTFFSDRGIKIKAIACGFMHSMALTDDGTVYSWGCDTEGQCGHGMRRTDQMVELPRMIEMTENINVTRIACGYVHSYFMTDDGGHFFFGKSHIYEYPEIQDAPWRINDCVTRMCGAKELVAVYVGTLDFHVMCRM